MIGNPQFRGKDDEYAAIWLVVRSAWEETTVRVSREPVTLKRGQCAYAISFLAEAWECSKTTAYSRLKRLETAGFISVKTERNHTLITVVKYDEYQAPGASVRGAFGARSARLDSERQLAFERNAETVDEQGVYAFGQTHVGTQECVLGERKTNAPRTNKKEGKELKEDSEANASGAEAPPDLKLMVFGKGLDWLAKQTGKPKDKLRSALGRACRDHGDAAVIEVLGAAQREGPIDPLAWMERAFSARSPKQKMAPGGFPL